MKERSDSHRRPWAALVLGGLVVTAAVAACAPAVVPWAAHVREDAAVLRAALGESGILAPIVFIAVQALQVVIAPIPGDVTGLLGGFFFGEWAGFLYSTLGLTLGSVAAFAIGRRFGAPLVRRFVSPRIWEQFGVVLEASSAVLCFAIFLVPGLPKDTACYVFGLSPMPLWIFAPLSTLGRMPGTWALSAQGAHAASGDYVALAAVTTVIAAFGLPFYWRRRQIVAWARCLGDAREPACHPGPGRGGAARAGVARLALWWKPVRFFDEFERQSQEIVRAAGLLHALVRDVTNARVTAAAIADAEREGDRITQEIVRGLNRVWGARLDREDLHALAVRLDDVLDEIDAAAERFVVYQVGPATSECRAMTDVIVATVGAMDRAARCLRHLDPAFADHAIEVNRLENVADDLLRRSVAELFDGAYAPVAVLRWKGIYETLEAVTDRCEDVTHLIEGLMLKHG